jgi:methylglyoxal synthase
MVLLQREALAKHKLIATGTTADILEGTINVPVRKILSGNLGGYRQLAELIEADKLMRSSSLATPYTMH